MFLSTAIRLLLLLLVFVAQSVAQQEPESAEAPAEPSIQSARERSSTSSRSHRARNIVTIGDNTTVAADDTVNDVVVIAGNTRIDGTVRGNLTTILGRVTLGSNASVRDLVIVAGSLDASPSAIISGERTVIGPGGPFRLPFSPTWFEDWLGLGLMFGRPLAHQLSWNWVLAGIFLLIYVLLAILFPRPVTASVEALSARPGGSFLTGLLALILIVPLIVLLVATVIGILAVPFVLCGFAAALVFGKVAVYRYAGEQLGHQLGASILERPLVALIIGILLFYLLYTIPFLGFIIWGAIVPLGIGAVLLAVFKSGKTNMARPTVPIVSPSPAGTPPPVTGSGSIAAPAPESVTVMPRVGFWMRLLATLIDLALISIVMSLLLRDDAGGWFIPVWVVYHAALWAWKGTTIGGIILGIKIVRLDGSPIGFSIALVRCLAAFLSAAVVFLGFFWAGWSADKQSWHDKIAGTCIVRVPKGVTLV